jgi:hypothetical protein
MNACNGDPRVKYSGAYFSPGIPADTLFTVGVPPDEPEDDRYSVDARGAQGMQVGERNTQIVFINVPPSSPAEGDVERSQVLVNANHKLAVGGWRPGPARR